MANMDKLTFVADLAEKIIDERYRHSMNDIYEHDGGNDSSSLVYKEYVQEEYNSLFEVIMNYIDENNIKKLVD